MGLDELPPAAPFASPVRLLSAVPPLLVLEPRVGVVVLVDEAPPSLQQPLQLGRVDEHLGVPDPSREEVLEDVPQVLVAPVSGRDALDHDAVPELAHVRRPLVERPVPVHQVAVPQLYEHLPLDPEAAEDVDVQAHGEDADEVEAPTLRAVGEAVDGDAQVVCGSRRGARPVDGPKGFRLCVSVQKRS